MAMFGRTSSKAVSEKSLKGSGNGSLPGGLSVLSPFRGFAGFANLAGLHGGDVIPKNLLWVMGLGVGGIIILIRRRGKHGLYCKDYKAFTQQFVLSPPNPKSTAQPRALKNLKFAVKDTYFTNPFVRVLLNPGSETNFLCSKGESPFSQVTA